ncbi:CDP-glycerol glycerophosphotransferase family protein [Enterococcus songbeiensis]|uniref:CDP-glycerol glycerophosphotransferase family protein n=1 Tax=Enterococcus songbeiensis TaxID=2559927 RepID=UPI0010F81898|nr:CDP-glycerol glycerophosphotransferase family protein [Enterococcus songbeiensis]
MLNLKAYTNGNYYFIECSEFNFQDLRISRNNEVEYFEKIGTDKWRISLYSIAKLLKKDQEDRAYIYYGKENKQISMENFAFKSNSKSLMTEFEHQKLFLYVTYDKFIRFIWNQVPSSKSYYKKSQVNSISIINDDKIKMELEVFTQTFSLNSIDFILSNRKELLKTKIRVFTKNTIQTVSGEYKNLFEVVFSPSEIFPELSNFFDYDNYDLSVFDYWINIQIIEHDLTTYDFRLFGPNNLPETSWLQYTNTDMIAINWYKTSLGNLSNRMSVLHKKEFNLFEKIKDNKHSMNKKPIVIIFEYPSKAQDNGMLFFKYMMEQQNHFEVYYLISKNSKDLENLMKFKKNIVFYKSLQHVELFFKADFFVHTHTPNYVLPVITTETLKKLTFAKKIFLQHGITGVRDIEYLYGKKSNPNLIDKFLVSSKREFTIVRDELFYSEEDIEITGFARFDALLKGNNKVKRYLIRKKILIMPTWRKGKETLSDQEFMETSFYKHFNELINDPILREAKYKNNLSISFYLHHNFQRYTHLFKSNFVNIIYEGSCTVQHLLKNHGVLITDYSSVGLDFVILKKSVIYYQFIEEFNEQRELEKKETFLPGPIIQDKKSLIDLALEKTRNNSIDKKLEKYVRENIYTFNDKKACKRIFTVLKNYEN